MSDAGPLSALSPLDGAYGKPYVCCVLLSVNFYRTKAGNEPVRVWLKGLPKGARKTVGSDIGLVQTMWPVGKPLVDGFGKGLYEVRSTHDKVEYRVLFGFTEGAIVLLHGFVHKTKATPQAEKDIGYDRLAEVKAEERRVKQTKKSPS